MKGKVINLFGDKNIIHNEGVRYSELLEKFISPFASDFQETEFYEDVIDFAISAWNYGNMNIIIPKDEFEELMATIPTEEVDIALLNRMINFKVANFKDHLDFIVDYEVSENNGVQKLAVVTQAADPYLNPQSIHLEDGFDECEFEENYINRCAIILKPLQPFLDWGFNWYPDDIDEMSETKTFLIDEEFDNIEAWVKKNFDKLFIHVLEGWNDNKKDWPQKRNYKMFIQWFQIDLSPLVYDLENQPVAKYDQE